MVNVENLCYTKNCEKDYRFLPKGLVQIRKAVIFHFVVMTKTRIGSENEAKKKRHLY